MNDKKDMFQCCRGGTMARRWLAIGHWPQPSATSLCLSNQAYLGAVSASASAATHDVRLQTRLFQQRPMRRVTDQRRPTPKRAMPSTTIAQVLQRAKSRGSSGSLFTLKLSSEGNLLEFYATHDAFHDFPIRGASFKPCKPGQTAPQTVGFPWTVRLRIFLLRDSSNVIDRYGSLISSPQTHAHLWRAIERG